MRSPVVPTPIDHDEVLRSLERETAVLLDRVLGEFLDLDLDREPVLEDFTAGQVLTYLSREADRMADELLIATGRPLPRYDADRRWDLDRGGLRPGAVLIEDFVESSERLSDAIASVGDWSTLDNSVYSIPGRRLVQLIVHHADLSRPWNELPEQDASIAVALLPSVIPEELGGVSLVARAEHPSMLSQTSDGLTVVEGDPRRILAWVSGRRFAGDPVDASLPDLGTRIWF
ncbi:maleylpyruvate isomerase N-terminal domain-containing protein [Microbacterium sp.]|uniref:maleylpyruvate isomerase N-terminal domain-containing protein n=1 Tax=Microbacterium sp. TaxID=51671 RepID=UPI00356A936B